MENLPDISPFRRRFAEIDALMAQPDFFQDQRKVARLSREHQKLNRLLEAHERSIEVQGELAEHRAIISDPESEEEFAALAREEIPALEEQLEDLRQVILTALIPPDSSDSRNTVMEIRAGTGGDEASLFAADLYRMYCRFVENRGWKIEPLGASESESGGFKQVVFLVTGEEAYKSLKFESGVHRVQRIPVTETNGRIHTSAATVAVLPEAEEVDVQIDPNDLEITVCRASGPGGQSVNTTDSAVQITHLPTNITVTCADERSQLKNKNKALKVLRARLLKAKEEEERAKYAADRKSQVGTGDRSERIRTYNFPQSRVTDHRIGFSLHSLPQFMDGEIAELLEALQTSDREAKIQEILNPGGEE